MNLSIYAKIVYQFYCRCADEEGSSFPKHDTTARACSMSVTKVKEANKELIEARLLYKSARFVKTDNGKMKQTSNLYVIFPEPYKGELPPEDGLENEDEVKKQDENINKNGSRNTPPTQTQYDPTPSRNTTPGEAQYDYKGLPTIRTTQKEVQSVCQSVEANNEIEELNLIKQRAELHVFEDINVRNMIENALELMFFSEFIHVGNAKLP